MKTIKKGMAKGNKGPGRSRKTFLEQIKEKA